MEYYRCTAKRPKSEDGEQRSSGARVNGSGGWRGRVRGGEEMPPQATVCKILANMKVRSTVDRFII